MVLRRVENGYAERLQLGEQRIDILARQRSSRVMQAGK
jgi:hypothetical protein